MQHYNSKIVEGEFKPNIIPMLRKRKDCRFLWYWTTRKILFYIGDLNMTVIEQISFPDHYFYSKKQIAKILEIAEKE